MRLAYFTPIATPFVRGYGNGEYQGTGSASGRFQISVRSGGTQQTASYFGSLAYNRVQDRNVSNVVGSGIGLLEHTVQPGESFDLNVSAIVAAKEEGVRGVAVGPSSDITQYGVTAASELRFRLHVQEVISTEGVRYAGSLTGIHYLTQGDESLEPIMVNQQAIVLTMPNTDPDRLYSLESGETLEDFAQGDQTIPQRGTGTSIKFVLPRFDSSPPRHFFRIRDIGLAE